MTLTGLAVRNLRRNKFRVALTVLGVAIAILTFLILRTETRAWLIGSTFAVQGRVVTRHKMTFILPLPKRYVQVVRDAPHVRVATWAQWFAGNDPKHEKEPFSAFAVDPATYFTVFVEAKVAPEALEAFQRDRGGAIVGDLLARKMGWNVGDRITLTSNYLPAALQLAIDGIYTTGTKTADRSLLVFQWDYLNDSLPPGRRDTIGWIISRIDDPDHVAAICKQLDRLFDDRDPQTVSQDERTFSVSMRAMYSSVLKTIDILSAVILAILTLVLGNTIAMGARERTGEYAVLRAIGFLPGHIVLWVVAESLLTGAIGGALGALAGWPFINLFIGRLMEETLGTGEYFRLETTTALMGVGLAALLGAAAAAFPARRAAGLRVVDALRRVA